MAGQPDRRAGIRPELEIEWEVPFLPSGSDPELLATARRQFGMIPRYLDYLAENPWVARALLRSLSKPRAYLDQELLELAALVAAQENACRYCYGAQRAGLRALGYRDGDITRLAEARELAELSPERRLVLQLARELSRANPRPGEGVLDQLVEAGHSAEAVAELTFYISLCCFQNRLMTFLAIPAQIDYERVTAGFLGALLRPIVRRRTRSAKLPPLPAPLEEEDPQAELIRALGRSPAAEFLRDTLAEARGSSVLSSRALPLALAVVARAIGCGICERGAREELAGADLGGEACDRLLDTLNVSELETIEGELVRYARESIWYSPVPMQRRTSELAERFGGQAAVEIAAVASLANALVRISVLVPWSRRSSS